ncbi:MAG: cation diffusion facilitator family transporter [Alphaproteobacteria bacterium]|nr:cation diffusion facilitator family transporter [Alphaproteobacteria bacterium]
MDAQKTEPMPERAKQAAVAAIVIVTILIVLKSFAYFQSGAVSILTSLIDSIMDSLVSAMALASIFYAQRPADEDHRWGHGKMEAVSALFQAAIIVGGSAFLIFEAFTRIFDPKPILDHWLGISVMAISIVLSVILVIIQRQALKYTGSLAIEAENLHYGSDVLVNIGTVIVLFISFYGAPLWIDALFAIIVAVFMIVMARGVAMKALNMLMDRELPDEDRLKIIKCIENHDHVQGWHDLRTRKHGECHDISFDIEVDPELSLWDAHQVTKDIERDLVKIFPVCDIMIHVDPKGYTDDERHRVKGIHM